MMRTLEQKWTIAVKLIVSSKGPQNQSLPKPDVEEASDHDRHLNVRKRPNAS